MTGIVSWLRGAQTPAGLWGRLDQCGVAFRSPMRDLIARHGHHPAGWVADTDICELPSSQPLISAQASPLLFDFTPQTDLSKPPPLLRCAVRGSHDHRLNYAHAVAALVKLFGQGQEASTADTTGGATEGTVARRWQFDAGWITCTVCPPERRAQGARNPRFDMFPDRATEAAIHIAPGYVSDG